MRTALNWGFVLRGSALAIAALVALAVLAAFWISRAFPQVPYAQPPSSPTIEAPAGELPAQAAGLQLWVRREGEEERLAGSAFVLLLPDGRVLGVTAAHNLGQGGAAQLLDRLTLRIANRNEEGAGGAGEEMGSEGADGGGAGGIVGQADIQVVGLHGAPGRPRRFGLDLSSDHALLALEGAVAGLSLESDPRGGAQAGERILLLSGVDGGRYEGIVFQADPQGIWCLMQEGFDPARVSGSPAVSLHTGKVVGMAVAAGWREDRLVLGLDPIGSLVEKMMSDHQGSELDTPDD